MFETTETIYPVEMITLTRESYDSLKQSEFDLKKLTTHADCLVQSIDLMMKYHTKSEKCYEFFGFIRGEFNMLKDLLSSYTK